MDNELKITQTPVDYIIQFYDGDKNETIAAIKPDGTVELSKKGADKEAAEMFWNSIQIEGQTLHQRIVELEHKLEVTESMYEELLTNKQG